MWVSAAAYIPGAVVVHKDIHCALRAMSQTKLERRERSIEILMRSCTPYKELSDSHNNQISMARDGVLLHVQTLNPSDSGATSRLGIIAKFST